MKEYIFIAMSAAWLTFQAFLLAVLTLTMFTA